MASVGATTARTNPSRESKPANILGAIRATAATVNPTNPKGQEKDGEEVVSEVAPRGGPGYGVEQWRENDQEND
jgi:hypothetical protein